MEGIAKTATQVKPTEPIVHTHTTEGVTTHTFDDIPIDIYRYFNQDLSGVEDRTKDKFKDIYDWAKTKVEELTIGNILQVISNLEMKLGQPGYSETRYDKIWNWVKISKNIDNLLQKRQTLERGIR